MQAEVVHCEQIGMIEHARGPGFLLEAAHAVGVSGECRGQNLDRDLAAEPRIPGPIYLTHPASAERREDLVRTKASSRSQAHFRV